MGCSHSRAAQKHLASATHRSQNFCFDWQRAEDSDSLRVMEKQAQRYSQQTGQPLKQYRPAEPHPLCCSEGTTVMGDSMSSLAF